MDWLIKLKSHPELFGFTAAIVGVMQSFIDYATPLLQFVGLLVGVLIGIVTLIIKVRQLREK